MDTAVCGIAGFVDVAGLLSGERMAAVGLRMARAIAHRGPDDEGVWTDESLGVTLAHRRLSIVDLSDEGRQPMVSASRRFVCVFNGEIYNFREIRDDLECRGMAPKWRGHSDTEVFLASCEAVGVDETIRRSNGMFAIAILDRAKSELVLVRDRMGEKPLYYGWSGKVLLFGSELKALEAFPGFEAKIDLSAISAYLRFGYIPDPLSIYKGIAKVQAGEVVNVDVRQGRGREKKRRYWTVPLPRPREHYDEGALVEELRTVLRDAVKSRMHADVPLGAFLSGGIDSSTIVALMQDAGEGRVRTYSAGFEDKQHDEAVHAAAVARALGTAHEEIYVSARDALNVVPEIPMLYDEPFADSSQIPMYLLSKLTRNHVTVALSGDAGDELFGGYVRYVQASRMSHLYAWVPHSVRRSVASAARQLSRPIWDKVCSLGPRSVSVALSSERLRKLAVVLEVNGCREMYGRLVSQWPDPSLVAPGLPTWSTPIDDEGVSTEIRDSRLWMMYLDSVMYLPGDILVKVDRASMAASLEARVPFLDHRVVEFAATLPVSAKIRGGTGKWALRQVLNRYVDPKLFERPKQGFAIPLASWLRGPLRDWAEELLSESALSSGGLLDPGPIREVWSAHLSGRENHHHKLWVILMLQSWMQRDRSRMA